MKKLLNIIIIIAMAVHLADAQTNSAYKKKEFVFEGDTLLYRVLWPQNFDKNKKYPVVLFLHGAGERGQDNEKQLVHGGDLFLKSQQEHPAIVIFPQCPAGDYWANVKTERNALGEREFHFQDGGTPTPALKLVSALLDSVISAPFSDNDRIYVAGLSMGGMGTFELVSRRPGTFAAAIAICGGGDPASAKKYAGKVPFWIFHGAKDDVVPPKNSKIMAEAIKKAGGDAKLTIYPEANHNSWDSAFAEPELLDWLFSKKK